MNLRKVFLFIAFTLLSSLSAREVKVYEIDSPTEAKPGKVALLKSKKGMSYFLRVPRGYKKNNGARLIVFLHGSNMNGLNYLETIMAQRWCKKDIIVCPNGEQGNNPRGANNFTFKSGPFVAEITEDIQKSFKITHSYLGGHSQGGFLTYNVILNYPDLFQGAFPMAGDCWMQNEPNLWEDKPDILAKQKKIAIAVIHGKVDPIVKFSQGEHAHGVFLAMGYPKLRFFAPEKLGHQFGLSPVPEALEWLDAMSGHNPDHSLKLTKRWLKEEWGWAHQAALAIKTNPESDRSDIRLAEKIITKVERVAADATRGMILALESKPAKEWIPQWFKFQQQFGATKAAKDLISNYNKSREKERAQAAQLFRQARALGRQKKKKEMNEKLEELLAETPHTFHTWYALRWLKQ